MIHELQVQGVFTENTYFYIDEHSKSGFLIDPGAQPGLIYDAIVRNGWKIEKILLTHGHFDHWGAAEMLSERLGTPIYISHLDARYLSDPYLNLSANSGRPLRIMHYEELEDNEIIRLKANSVFYLRVISTPGHSPGSVIFYTEKDKAAFIGDTLYQHGPGLTNFPGGNARDLKISIVTKILSLPDDTLLLSGHSSPITVAEEKRMLL